MAYEAGKNFKRHLIKRYGVTEKQLADWYQEYEEDMPTIGVYCSSNSKLRYLNKYLCDIDLQRKYRKCKNYQKLDDYTFEGIDRQTNDKIKINLDKTRKKTKRINVYINNQLFYECGSQAAAIAKLKEYYNE